MKYIHNNGYLEPLPRMEKPEWNGYVKHGSECTNTFLENLYKDKATAYVNWLAARIPVGPGTTWEDREYSDNEFDVKECDCTGLGQKYNHCDIFSPCDVAYPLPVVEEKVCTHEPLIDTGVGYYHCPACNTGFTYDEWHSKTKPADPLDIPRFTARDMISHVTQILSGDYIYTCKCNHDIAEYVKEYFKSLNPTQP